MALMQAQNLSKSFGTRMLFSGVSFEVYPGDRIGLIGVNGCGKTTLLSILTGDEEPDDGALIRAKDCSLGVLAQTLPCASDMTLYDAVLEVFRPLMDMEEMLEKIAGEIESWTDGADSIEKLIDRQSRLRETYEARGGMTYRSRTGATLLGLGFAQSEFQTMVSDLSGGEARKAMLARLLLSETSCLLLDEPTNHLDLGAIEWLEEFLLGFRGTYLVVSHDRYFLDRVTNKTFEMKNGTLYHSNGNYSRHLALQMDVQETAERKYANMQREIRRIESIIEQQRRWNQERNYVTIASKQKQIDRIRKDLVKPEAPPAHIRFHFQAPEPSGNEVVVTKGLQKAFGQHHLFYDVSFYIGRGEHVCLLGANGCGKTTLLRMLLGREPVDDGTYRIGANVQAGYYEQNMRSLAPEKTIFDEISDAYPRMDQQQIRNALGTFLFRGDDVFKLMGQLSGGELARVQLLKLMLSPNNLLLMDEPTNHLDIPSREQLENALADYNGTLLVVTHDRYFINRIADRILILTSEGVREFSGDWDGYRNAIRAGADVKPATDATVGVASASGYTAAKAQRSAQNKAKGALDRLEKQIAEKEAELSELELRIQSPALAADYAALSKLGTEIEQAKSEINSLYEDWDRAESELRLLATEG